MIKWFLRQFYKIPVYESRGDNTLYGRFRVQYADGRISEPMCYKHAKNYAEMFSGKVIDKEKNEQTTN